MAADTTFSIRVIYEHTLYQNSCSHLNCYGLFRACAMITTADGQHSFSKSEDQLKKEKKQNSKSLRNDSLTLYVINISFDQLTIKWLVGALRNNQCLNYCVQCNISDKISDTCLLVLSRTVHTPTFVYFHWLIARILGIFKLTFDYGNVGFTNW